MRTTRFAVVESPDAWRIHVDGRPLARFDNQLDAVNCAAGLAADVQKGGGSIELLVQDLVGDIVVLDDRESGRSKSAAA